MTGTLTLTKSGRVKCSFEHCGRWGKNVLVLSHGDGRVERHPVCFECGYDAAQAFITLSPEHGASLEGRW